MRKTTTLALFVFAGSLANATLNYSDPELDLSVPMSDSGFDLADFFVTASDLPSPGTLEPANATIVRYDLDDASAWIELFHQR